MTIEDASLVLKEFPYTWDAPSGSPFCAKVVAYCRFAGIPLKRETADYSNQPKGKLPVLKDGDETVCDSYFIINHLKNKYRDLDVDMTPEERGISTSLRVMIEEWMYIIMANGIFVDEQNTQTFANHFLNVVPWPFRSIVSSLVARSALKDHYAQGFGRHTSVEKFELSKEVAESLDAKLGDNAFLFGDRPTSLDATLYGFLVIVLANTGLMYPLKALILREKPRLVDYVKRIRDEFFPEETWNFAVVDDAYEYPSL